MSKAITYSRSPRRPMVKRRPLAIDIVEYPRPAPVAFQTRGGPSAGHCFSKPVSFEIPSRLGPRHCGHSPGIWATRLVDKKRKRIATLARVLVLMFFMIRHLLYSCGSKTL